MVKIDLHIHSTASDGKFSPKELIDIAISRGIPVIALTDHDTASGNIEAIEYAKKKDFEFIPGIEITVTPPKETKELHIVGLYINSVNKEILDMPKKHRNYTEEVVKKIIKKLGNLGYKITFEELLQETNGEHLGRPFIAKILMRRYPREFPDRKAVFNELLGKQGKAFVRAKGTSMEEAIRIIHNAGGIAIIAHPYYLGQNMEKIINEFVKLGGDGVEIDYSKKDSISENIDQILRKIAKKNNLVISGGTDFHETKNDGKEIGDNGISLEEFEKLKKFKNKKDAQSSKKIFKNPHIFFKS